MAVRSDVPFGQLRCFDWPMEGEGPLRIWIDDRHPVFRRGVRAILTSAGFTVVGESADLEPEPECTTLDILMFAADGAGLGRAVQLADGTGARLVALLHQPTEQLLADAVEAGTTAVLLRRDLDPVGLISSLRSASVGNSSLPMDLLPRLLERAANGSNGGTRRLTDRELSVLRLLAEGDDTGEIASQLAYSVRTVKNIVHDVLMKMNCRNRVHAVAQATRQGLI